MKQDIELHIETLSIEGYSKLDALRMKDAIERELTVLLRQPGWVRPENGALVIPDLTLGTLPTSGLSAVSTGAQIAKSIYKGIQSVSTIVAEPSINKTI